MSTVKIYFKIIETEKKNYIKGDKYILVFSFGYWGLDNDC